MAGLGSWLIGGGAPSYSNKFAGSTQAAIGSLQSGNYGQLGAQGAERAIGRRYERQLESIEGDQNFGRNAAVSSAMRNDAAETAGFATGNAYVKGAEQDAESRAKAGMLANQAAQTELGYNQLNYQSEQDHSFGNSFLEHDLFTAAPSAVSIGAH